uniref:Uncharacterized protein n=1 Tax=Cajanus cajan TaxID=3821 RepID=A0A151TT91_CAJCA|nr:hypothetical protein KK1_009432 [Cajanus cajan]
MTKIGIILTLLVAVTASCFVCALRNGKIGGFYLVVALVTIASVILAFRATTVALITVLVLLAFAGNRRMVLIQRGGRISLDVAWCLLSVTFGSQKGLFALACATLLSLFATYR